MNSKLNQSILGGIIGTVVMSFVMHYENLIGLPRINPEEVLSNVLNIPVVLSWIFLFIIGISYALFYTYIFSRLTAVITNNVVRGVLFGFALAIFVFVVQIGAQNLLTVSQAEGNKLLLFIGTIFSHLFYGICVGIIVKVHYQEDMPG